MTAAILLAILLALMAVAFFWLSSRMRTQTGLPAGRIVYADPGLWGKVEKPLYDPLTHLVGKPDFLVKEDDLIIPVEMKSGWAPDAPRDSHVFQLAAYCLLVERSMGVRPPYGLIRYRNRTFAVDYTPELQHQLLDLLEEVRSADRQREVARSHEQPGRCEACGFKGDCTQKL